MASKQLIGIDVGTTGAKGILINDSGKVVVSAFAEYPLDLPQPGWAEQDPELWVAATIQIIRELLQKSDVTPDSIVGMSLSGQMHGLVCLDAGGVVLRPAILWCDTRTTEQCRQIEAIPAGNAVVLHHTCNVPLEGFTLPKLLWVRDHEPEVYRQTRTILLPKDYVRFRLTGKLGMDYSDAAGTLLLDVRERRWSTTMAEALNINMAMLPPLGESTDIAGHLTSAMAEATGLHAGLPVAYGGADNACAAVGTGVISEGITAVSIGTSGTVIAPVARSRSDMYGRLHSFNHAVPKMWYVIGVMQAAGLSMKWFRDTLCSVEANAATSGGEDFYDILTAEAAAVPPGAEGLLWLPYLNGERTPHMDPNAKGVLFGITPRHTRGHIVRAIMEGVAFGLKDSLLLIDRLSIDTDEIRIIGGGGKNQLWTQIIADVFQKPISSLANEEGPALGAAIIAGVGTGVFPDFETACNRFVHVTRVTTPNPQAASAYDAAYVRYKRLYETLREEFALIS